MAPTQLATTTRTGPVESWGSETPGHGVGGEKKPSRQVFHMGQHNPLCYSTHPATEMWVTFIQCM